MNIFTPSAILYSGYLLYHWIFKKCFFQALCLSPLWQFYPCSDCSFSQTWQSTNSQGKVLFIAMHDKFICMQEKNEQCCVVVKKIHFYIIDSPLIIIFSTSIFAAELDCYYVLLNSLIISIYGLHLANIP